MPKRKAAAKAVDPEARAIIERARRVAACEREVLAAVAPILARYRCRLGTVQEIVDGQPGPVRIVVITQD